MNHLQYLDILLEAAEDDAPTLDVPAKYYKTPEELAKDITVYIVYIKRETRLPDPHGSSFTSIPESAIAFYTNKKFRDNWLSGWKHSKNRIIAMYATKFELTQFIKNGGFTFDDAVGKNSTIRISKEDTPKVLEWIEEQKKTTNWHGKQTSMFENKERK